MFLYRLGNKLHYYKVPFLPKVMNGLIRLIHNCAVFSETQIGQGTQFGYGGIAVVIHKRTIIGKNCMIGSNVTIGGRSRSINVPVVGDNVFISTGAKILGDIKIGDNSVIGANAVVIHSVPENCIVAGVPAKIIKKNIDPSKYK